ncbi:MAG: anthranilate synthase component I family protein [Pyrobaculum sp.]
MAYFKSGDLEIYVEGEVVTDLAEVSRYIKRGGVAVGLFSYHLAPWENISVRKRASWPDVLFVVGRRHTPPGGISASCKGVPAGGVEAERYMEAVKAAKEAIARGEVFQLVVARFVKYETDCRPREILRRLTAEGRYRFFLEAGELGLAGISPEILVKVRDGVAVSGPIGGTKPRGATEEEDRALEAELLNSAKERAEHIMLIDSVRNDLGRVCRWGTVTPAATFVVEKYNYVQHLVSYIQCRLDGLYTPLDAVTALNPTTTVTGVPKPRAMELIDSLEAEPRGPFAGSFGVVTQNWADFAVIIRSIYLEGGHAYLWAGAGVVADSTPEGEFRETEVKMAPLRLDH